MGDHGQGDGGLRVRIGDRLERVAHRGGGAGRREREGVADG